MVRPVKVTQSKILACAILAVFILALIPAMKTTASAGSYPDLSTAITSTTTITSSSTTSGGPTDWPAWNEYMFHMPTPQTGCFQATYPSTEWQQSQCASAPLIPLFPSAPSTVGNGYDEVARSPSTLIGVSTGSFQSVTGLTSETDSLYGADYYTLQDNSNFFTTNTPYTGSKSTTGWEQFVFANYPPYNVGYIFIQYWLLGYYNAYGTCPSTGPPSGSSWMAYSGSCYANSPGGLAPFETATNLANLILKGYANFSSNDEVVFCVAGGSCYAVAITDHVVDLYLNWFYAEFNVFGWGSGSQANFNSGTSITVVNGLSDQSGNVIVPSCVITGYTGETNNLNLGSCSSNGNGQIIFTESNAPQTITQTARATLTTTQTSTLYSTTTQTVTSFTSTQSTTSTIQLTSTVVLIPSTTISTVESTQSLTSITSTTVTSYTSTQTLTSTIPIVTTVTLAPSTTTSTVQITQIVTLTGTTTVVASATATSTSYTSTETLPSTIIVTTTITVAPSTTTQTIQTTQVLTLISTTTVTGITTVSVTSYTSTTTATSTTVIYTTVTTT